MAEQKIAAPFPAPPPFYKHFTKQNLTRLRQLRREAGISQPQPAAANSFPSTPPDNPNTDFLLSLPQELRHLIPPPLPENGKYTSFGLPIDLLAAEPTLSSASIEQLYPTHPSVRLNPQPHLLAFSRSLLTTFLSLTGALSRDPTRCSEPPVEDLQTLLYNAHDLINQYRPHQARETLILNMEERVERMRAEIRAVEEAKGRVRKLLEGLRDAGVGLGEERDGGYGIEERGADEVKVTAENKGRRERQRAAWKALEEMESG